MATLHPLAPSQRYMPIRRTPHSSTRASTTCPRSSWPIECQLYRSAAMALHEGFIRSTATSRGSARGNMHLTRLRICASSAAPSVQPSY